MKAKETKQIAPVLVLSTGRCGSTMISGVLNRHPDVLSLSEVFSLLGPLALFRKRLGGKAMWALCSRQNPALRVLRRLTEACAPGLEALGYEA